MAYFRVRLAQSVLADEIASSPETLVCFSIEQVRASRRRRRKQIPISFGGSTEANANLNEV